MEGPNRPAVNWRSLTLGTALSALLAAAAPYNDFVVGNGFLVATYVPVFLVFWAFILTMCVNRPLRRWRAGWAFSPGESAVVAAMVLAACAIPNQGLLRAWLPSLVYPFHHGHSDPDYWSAFTRLGLPRWLFPMDPVHGPTHGPIVDWFYTAAPAGETPPYGAWVVPILAWGVFIAAMLTAVGGAASLVYQQWTANERLAFPIAQVELSLLDPPDQPGTKSVVRGKGFWIGLGIAFLLQNQSALHLYFPKQMPAIPLDYDLTNRLTAEPWTFLSENVKKNQIVFVYAAMAYLVRANVAFSVWSIYLILQVAKLFIQATTANDLSSNMLLDQHLGAGAAYLAGIFWIGRKYWKTAWKKPAARWTAAGLAVMVGWLLVMGVAAWMAVAIVVFIVMAHILVARVVAETGLPSFRTYSNPGTIYLRTSPGWFSGRDVFFAQSFTVTGTYNTRESLAVFVQHGRWLSDATRPDPKSPRVKQLGPAMAWAIFVSFVFGVGSSLHAYYHHAVPMTRQLKQEKINPFGVETVPTDTIATPFTAHSHGRFNSSPYNPWTQMAIGLTAAAALSAATANIANWPLLPVGYVVNTSPYGGWVWYSVLLGWLAKMLTLRLGGSKGYQTGKPVVIGLIVGEALAAGVWLAVSLTLAATGHDYQPVKLYPS